MEGTFLYAGFGAMMSTPDLIGRLSTIENPLDPKLIQASIVSLEVSGWSLGYYGKSSTWGNCATADIMPDSDDSIYVVVAKLPIWALDRLCVVEGVYTGRYRFDSIWVEQLNERVLVTRLRRKEYEELPGKSSVQYVARMVKGAVANSVPIKYICDVILARAGLELVDLEKFFDEEFYSEDYGEAGRIMRDWVCSRKHIIV